MSRKKTLQRAITVSLAIGNLCLLVLFSSAWIGPQAQSKMKTISKWRTLNVEPVDITEFTANGKHVNSDQEFESGEADWLKSIAFKVTNRSDKTITFIAIDLTFPETKGIGSGGIALHQIMLGLWPESKAVRPPLHLGPGETTEVSLAAQYDDFKSLLNLKQSPVDSITNAVIRLNQVLFDDGTLWSGGEIYRRNPDLNNPRKWIRMDK